MFGLSWEVRGGQDAGRQGLFPKAWWAAFAPSRGGQTPLNKTLCGKGEGFGKGAGVGPPVPDFRTALSGCAETLLIALVFGASF